MIFLKKPERRVTITLVVVLAVFLLFPLLGPSNYIVTVCIQCMVFGALGVAWNIIGGYGGQIGWCHASFVAVGAYTSTIIYTNMGLSPIITFPLGMILSVVLATIVGKVSFRYRGPFFAITTIAFSEIVRVVLIYWKSLTKGTAGLAVPYHGASPFNLVFDSDLPFYYIMIFVLALVVFITWLFINSKTGYYLRAIKGDETACRTLGIDSGKVKLQAFQLSAALSAMVGVVYAFFQTFIAPDAICGLDFTIRIVSCVIIGGIGTLFGPVIGAFIVLPLIEVANTLITAGSQMLFGIMFITIVVLQPAGVVGIYKTVARQFKKKKEMRLSHE